MTKKSFILPDDISAEQIRKARKVLRLKQVELAELANVSVKTVERWESQETKVTGPVVTLLQVLLNNPQILESIKVPKKELPLRLWYMYKNEVCTIIDVDETTKRVKVHNFTQDLLFRAFGKRENITFEEYEEFLESRCFPRSRDKMKLILRELDIPFYDPMLIIEKTDGRMAEDDFWIRLERR